MSPRIVQFISTNHKNNDVSQHQHNPDGPTQRRVTFPHDLSIFLHYRHFMVVSTGVAKDLQSISDDKLKRIFSHK